MMTTATYIINNIIMEELRVTSQHAVLIYQKVGHFGGQVQIWTVTKAYYRYRAGSVDRESGANDGTVRYARTSRA